ncbi:MAG: ATP-binding protein [Verrucomicrobia bacterium]|nr:ATP-binding protein [Verrucomicrobiota bacterium]
MSGFQIFAVAALTALVVSGLWGALIVRIRREGKSSQEKAAMLREQLVSTRADMEHHRDAVFDAMAEGVMLCELSGKVVFMNRAIRQLFRIPENVPDGITLLEALRLHEVHEVFERTVKNGRTMGVELNPSALESKHLMLNAVVVHDASGKPEGVLLIFHDFTRLKELESARRDFVANVSHELRTPLSMIKGFVETVIDHPSMDQETLTSFLGKVQKHSDRLALLIEDLLTISKLESGQATVNLRELRLCLEISRVVGDLQRSAEKRNIEVSYSVPKDMFVKADADLLEQILLNLIDNAVKYGKSGGKVEVRAMRNGADQVCVSISDDGPGIPSEATDRIFERFFRVDKARSRSQGGTGLGLSIVKHIAQTLGGRVWVESELGKGSTFFFTLKSSAAKDNSSHPPTDALSSAA